MWPHPQEGLCNDWVNAQGTDQSVMLYELDGPRKRKVNLQVYGE
jgi:thiamine phosphate synthase YjbQ (UPF0047 family)